MVIKIQNISERFDVNHSLVTDDEFMEKLYLIWVLKKSSPLPPQKKTNQKTSKTNSVYVIMFVPFV